ncbi:MAG TPA: AmmeMemoRadiSam system protein A [Candidatus Paceibacterota bacterium]|nr:AmmeMemoRadiSam system protein A [Candidatus Paceibacterota bacterium]
MNKENKEYLLKIARRAMQKYFQDEGIFQVEEDELPQSLKGKKGTFVTLWKNNELRGCIGNLESEKSIYQSVIDNCLASALLDPRFTALKSDELNNIKIEISILSELKKFPNFTDHDSFLKYLNKYKPGLLIKKGAYQATFLPQVWEDLNFAELFISHLCEKAGLEKDEWKKMDLEIYQYSAEVFKEE